MPNPVKLAREMSQTELTLVTCELHFSTNTGSDVALKVIVTQNLGLAFFTLMPGLLLGMLLFNVAN